jgi:glycolate oxidase subunit GlcD
VGPVLRADLSRLVGGEHVHEVPPESPYNRDAGKRAGVQGRAEAVVLPGSAEEVRAVVAWCYEHDVAIVPRGGGTGMMGGAVAVHGGVVISLERMRRVRELEPALWRMLVEAGLPTSEVKRLARENGLMFAPDPGASEQSQIGGNVATNAGGPHALKYGVTGAWVASLEVVLAPGELVHVGGWAAKDVAGYDLRSLLIGSEGTLGVITAVGLRLLPAPETAHASIVLLSDRERGCEAMRALPAAGLRPSVLDFLDGETLAIMAGSYPLPQQQPPPGAGFALILEFDGERETVSTERRTANELLGQLDGVLRVDDATDPDALWRWRDGANGVVTAQRGAKISEDVVFPVERLAEGLARFEEIASRQGLQSCAWGHGGEGNVHATVLVDPQAQDELARAAQVGEELFALVVKLGGSVAGEHGVGYLKRGRLAAQWDGPAVELHEGIKRLFDPKGLMNPGKKLAR